MFAGRYSQWMLGAYHCGVRALLNFALHLYNSRDYHLKTSTDQTFCGHNSGTCCERFTCSLLSHDWSFCRCMRCGETRNSDHDWKNCTCSVCGANRGENHAWDSCVCRVCGAKRDSHHPLYEGCVCPKCGKEQHTFAHCKCTICGATRIVGHTWDDCICTTCGKHRHKHHPERSGCVCPKCGEETHDWETEMRGTWTYNPPNDDTYTVSVCRKWGKER
jgi:hypothetical protein